MIHLSPTETDQTIQFLVHDWVIVTLNEFPLELVIAKVHTMWDSKIESVLIGNRIVSNVDFDSGCINNCSNFVVHGYDNAVLQKLVDVTKYIQQRISDGRKIFTADEEILGYQTDRLIELKNDI